MAHTLRLTASSQLRLATFPHLSPSALPLRALVIVTPSTIADKSFAIWLHFAFGIFPLRLPLACATNFERNMSSKVSLSVALSVCPSIYLYLVYLAGSLSVTQPSLSLLACLSVFRLPRFRNRNKECTCHIVYRGICHFARIAAAATANAVGHFSHYISVSSPLPPPDTTPANLRLPPLQSYALLVLVCRRRVPQIAACVRCSKQTNKNQNTNNNNKNNNK